MREYSLVFLLILISGCSKLIFHPLKEHVRTPEALGLIYQDVFLHSKDSVKIHGWFLPAEQNIKGSIYFLHGNAENISTHINSVHWLPKYGYQVFLLDYRGFGLSEGKPGIKEVFMDIEAGFSWLLAHAENKPVFILGQSIGASLAIYFTANNQQARENLSGLVSDSGFTGYAKITQDVAGSVWLTWPIQYPLAWLMDYPYDPIEAIGLISPVPVLISHGRNDQIVPFAHAIKLYESAEQPKYFLASNEMHIETFLIKKNRLRLLDFFARSAQLAKHRKDMHRLFIR